jgi:maltose/moltooligosaccharide transporter
MRRLGIAMLCQWFAMFAYWQFIAFALARALHNTADPASRGFRDAVLTVGQIGAFYNAIAFVAAFALVPITRRFGPGRVHAACLTASGIAMLAIPGIGREAWLYLPMLGIGIGWASMMGNPYVMLTDAISPEKFGVYMGIFNMFIVVPMMIESLLIPLVYQPLLGGDPRHIFYLAGGLMLAGAVATLRVQVSPAR